MGSGVDGTVHYVHDAAGNIIAETDGTGATVREYIWIPGVGYAGVALPIAVVDGVNTATPATYYVHTDHVSRPIKMTDANKASVWDATWLPFGGAHSITGSAASEQRFPGQWFQIEAGLHYNWHRHYDASLGRYTQPDPLGFVDGPSVYAYARNNPQMYVDPRGLDAVLSRFPGIGALCTLGLVEPTPLGEVACVCAIGLGLSMMSKADGCSGNNSCGMGPSGKPKIHKKRHPTRKRAKDAARQEGDGKPVSHPSPTKGRRHFHPTRKGRKKKGSTHHEY